MLSEVFTIQPLKKKKKKVKIVLSNKYTKYIVF